MSRVEIVTANSKRRSRRGHSHSPLASSCYNIEDVAAKILDRVSRISISEACSPTVSSSVHASEVSFAEEEGYAMPSIEIPIFLAPSPLRSTRRAKRMITLDLTPIRVVGNPCLTPRACSTVQGPRAKKRRACLTIPSSPIVSGTNHASHIPCRSPSGPFETRLDCVTAPYNAEPESSSECFMHNDVNFANPFSTRGAHSDLPPPITRSVRCRRERLLCWTVNPMPYFPVLSPSEQACP